MKKMSLKINKDPETIVTVNVTGAGILRIKLEPSANRIDQ